MQVEKPEPGAASLKMVPWPARRVIALASLLYFLLALFSILGSQGSIFAPFWYANAVGVLCLLLLRRTMWLPGLTAVGLANLAANLVAGYGLASSLSFVPGNLTEIALTFWVIDRYIRTYDFTDTVPIFLRFTLFAILIPSAVGGVIGAALLDHYNVVPFLQGFQTWYVGDIFGLILLLPMGVVLVRHHLVNDWELTGETVTTDRFGTPYPAIVDLRFAFVTAVMILVTWLAAIYTSTPFVWIAAGCAIAAVSLNLAQTSLLMVLISVLFGWLINSGDFYLLQRDPDEALGSLRLSLLVSLFIPLYISVSQRNLSLYSHKLVSALTLSERTGQALRRSEERYRAVLQDQTEIICRILSDGTIVYCNAAYCRLFGRDEEELLGAKWQPIAHPDDLAMIETRLTELGPTNPVVVIENRVFDSKGDLRWMQFVNRGLFDEMGQLLEIQAVGRDITPLKDTEEALRQAHAAMEQRVIERTDQLRHLAVEATLAEDRERAALARDLHDDLGQMLHVARLQLDGIQGATANPNLRPALMEKLGDTLQKASRMVRSFTAQLSPPVLSRLGLFASLHWLCDDIGQTYGLRVTADIPDMESPWAPESAQSIVLYRAVRELLINVTKHARASCAHIDVSVSDKQLEIAVDDDGIGLGDAKIANEGCFGLFSVRERLVFLGGYCEFGKSAMGGARIVMALPLKTPRRVSDKAKC